MKRKHIDCIWLWISIISFLLLSLSFMLMPIESEDSFEGLSKFSLVAGIMFWISLVAGIVTQIVLVHRRKKWYVANRVKRGQFQQKIGIISFFRNAYAIMADIVAILSLIGLIIAMVATHGTGYICYILVSVFVFAFCMHCILNGKVYYYVINQNKLLQNIERERANKSKEERVRENA